MANKLQIVYFSRILRTVSLIGISLVLTTACPLHCFDLDKQTDCAGLYGAVCEWDVDGTWPRPAKPWRTYTPCRQRGGGDGRHGGEGNHNGNQENPIDLCALPVLTTEATTTTATTITTAPQTTAPTTTITTTTTTPTTIITTTSTAAAATTQRSCPVHCSDLDKQTECAGLYGAVCEWDVDGTWPNPRKRHNHYTPCRQRGGGDGHHGGQGNHKGTRRNLVDLCSLSASTLATAGAHALVTLTRRQGAPLPTLSWQRQLVET